MNTGIIVLGILVIVFAVALVVAVLLQSGKDKKLSGAIGGGVDTYFGKNKGKTLDRVLPIVTTVMAIIFVALVVVLYVWIAKMA